LRIFDSESETARETLGVRARRILGADLSYIAHPSFDDPNAHDAILAPAPEPVASPSAGPMTPSATLSREQEAHLFRKMNYLKRLAARLRDHIDPHRPATADLDEVERLQAEAQELRNHIVESNLRLVFAVVKRRLRPGHDRSERVSDGQFALLLAADRFDCTRGTRFSTYATWAIFNELARYDRRERRHRCNRRFAPVQESFTASGTAGAKHELAEDQGRRRAVVERWLDRLDGRERRILASRHGIGGGPERTLKEIGRDLGISKERVRQLEGRAQDKLRKFARLEAFELSEI
jgi:RNA polymerase primary sigma factor